MTYSCIYFVRASIPFGMSLLNYLFLNIFFIFIGYKFQVYSQLLDPLQTEKCRLRCIIPDRSPEFTCLRACLSVDVKPGKCPTEINSTLQQSGKTCINSCKTDPQCPRIKKCCRHDCGAVCITPTELDTAEGLPPIPTQITVHVNETDISSEGVPIHLRWYLTHHWHNKHMLFVVEERHNYDENGVEKMNDTSWTVVRRTPHRYATVRNVFKPGLYYQFRVYSVNINGSAGPSKPTKPFQILPNITEVTPEPPIDFGVGAQSWGNGSLRFLLVWRKPPTLIPIYRYKISWSMLLNQTLFQNSKYLSANLDHYWLGDIMPLTEYYLELYAMVKIDVKKIPGKSSRIVVRTQEQPPPKKRKKVMPDELNLKYKDTINTIRVTKLYWIQENLYAIVDWKPIDENVVANYSVTWAPNEACIRYKAWYVAISNETQFEIYDLVPGCDYNISIKAIHNETLYTGSSLLPIVKCFKKLTKQQKAKKEFSFTGAEIPVHPEFKPVEIVDCPLPETYRPGD